MLLSGWLTKKGSANAFSSGNTWRRRYFQLCVSSSGAGAVLKYFTSDATAAANAPRGETPVQPNSVVRVLDTEAALLEHGLSGKFLGKRLLVFHGASTKDVKTAGTGRPARVPRGGNARVPIPKTPPPPTNPSRLTRRRLTSRT